MAIEGLQDILPILTTHSLFMSYFIIFLLMFFEGPIVAYLASILAAWGYLNIWIIFIIYILGNQIPDIVYYFLGRFARKGFIERIICKFGLNEERMLWLEKIIKKHSIKTMLLIKFVPIFSLPGILISGFIKMSLTKFFWINLVINFILAVIFCSLGFYSGTAINYLPGDIKKIQYILPAVLLFVGALYLIIKKISKKSTLLIKQYK